MIQTSDALKAIDQVGIDQVSKVCGADITPLVSGMQRIAESLQVAQDNLQSALDVSDCATITPILDGVFHGAICNEAVTSLTWMFGTAMAITILGSVLVTLRAALYNATIRGPKRSKDEERQREFKEYQNFMSEFYEDTHGWKLQGASTDMTKVERGGIGITPSFETGATSPSSHDDDSYDSDDSSIYLDSCYEKDDDLDQSTLGPAEYNTPRKNIVASAPSFVEQIKVDEKIRHLTHILAKNWSHCLHCQRLFHPHHHPQHAKDRKSLARHCNVPRSVRLLFK